MPSVKNGKIEEVPEVIHSIWNAMRRSEDAAWKQVLRYAIDRPPILDRPPRVERTDRDELEAIGLRTADAYVAA